MTKKILAFTPIFYPHMGGAERTVYELYSRLVHDYGYTVALVTLNTEDAPPYELLDGLHVYRIGKSYKSKVIKILMLQVLFSLLYIRKFWLRRWNVLHVHYAFHLAPISLFFRYILRKKLIVSEYHFGTGADIASETENPSYANRLCGMVYRAATRILTISQDNKQFIARVSGKDTAKVIKQGTDHTFFSPEYFDEERKKELLAGQDFLLVTTSRISTRKNIEDMIRAVRMLSDKGIATRLLINGKVDRGNEGYFAELKSLIKELEIESHVVFNGFVSDEDMRVIYACSDLFLLTSKYEGFGIANVEALASGTPVITYDTGAARDFIVDNKNGFVTENTPTSVTEHVARILNDEALLRHMQKAARVSVEKELNWATYAENNNTYIKELL